MRGNFEIRPVVAAILRHPALYEGPRMVKSPVLYTAGLLRRIGRPIDTTSWVWLDSMSGQQLFYPPNVGGWDDTRWLDTASWRGRWWIAQSVLDRRLAVLWVDATNGAPARADKTRVYQVGWSGVVALER